MESFSWYYFNQNLHNSLNIELLAYMEKSSRGNLSGIRADLLQVIKFKNENTLVSTFSSYIFHDPK